MGQDTSLNCRSSQKQEQHEIQTTQANALHLLRSRNSRLEPQDSDIKSKKSTTVRTEVENYSSSNVSAGEQKRASMAVLPQHENILRVAYSPFAGAERTGNKYSERGSKSLAEIVEARYNSTMHFPQAQVVGLVESLVYSLRYMQKFQYKHHDYYPTNIHYCAGLFKITNPLLTNSSAYVLTQQRKRFSFLAPELISELLNETPQGEIPLEVMWKADVFAIGMIVLEFCTLLPSAECFDEESYSLVDKVIRERLVEVANLYSANIADCIAEMLRYEVEERISVEELALLVFLNGGPEKAEAQTAVDPRMSASKPAVQGQRQQYQQNPPHVQQQYLILPPGQPQPINQPLPLPQNSIALPTPNYAYTRIGPNNQGLLSPTTLQNKLKVIELIHEKPLEEEESEGQISSLPSNVLPVGSNQPSLQPRQHLRAQPQSQPQSQPQTYTQLQYAIPSSQYSHYARPQQTIKQAPKTYDRYQVPDRQPPISLQQKPAFYHDPTELRPSTRASPGNKFLLRTDQNGQTLQQRVQRILQMSRSIK